MNFADVIQVMINNGAGLGIAVYFLMKDWKQSQQHIEADKARVEADASQTEVMRQLCNTIEELRITVEELKKQ